jgi:glycosyltransferase involved in cell wall biosynthesis
MSRTVLLTRRFPPETCGVGDYSLRLAEYLTRQGEQVTVITGPTAGVRPPEFRVLDFPMSKWRDLQPLLRAIQGEHPDRVQLEYSAYGWSRWGFLFWLNALAFSLRRRGLPMALALHEVPIRMRQHPLQIPIALLQWLHTLLLVAAADRVAVNLPERVTLLRRLFFWCGATIFYRPNSATIPAVPQNAEQRRALREARGVQPGETVVATFGMFQAGKNLEGAIDAVAVLRRERPVKLWLLGDSRIAKPSYIAALQERARKSGMESSVFWSGYFDPAEVSAHLHAADIFLLPQPDGHVTRSSALMAAAAHGLPVVAVRNTRNQGEFLDGGNIFLAESGDPAELAAAIDVCVCDPGTAGKAGSNLKRLYQERFDWPVTAEAFGGGLSGACAPATLPPAAALSTNRSTKARGEA